MTTAKKTSGLNFAPFFNAMRQSPVSKWADDLEEKTRKQIEEANHGDFADWLRVLESFPCAKPSITQFKQAAIQIGKKEDLSEDEFEILKLGLKKLHPWRKGPFELFGIFIDTEWRSDLKWERVVRAVQPLAGRRILDLGCGNGYYLWRMLGEGAELALGVDPSLHYAVQFQVFQKYVQDFRAAVLPLGAEDLPPSLSGFDAVFSMGLLYHRRDPLEHLSQLLGLLRSGGELVLETLVIDGKAGDILKPGERYAKMRNVWHVPACGTVESWLNESGFSKIRCVDVSVTTMQEQRKTEWMTYESLEDFLDPQDSSKTIEGHPAPKRAVFLAEKS